MGSICLGISNMQFVEANGARIPAIGLGTWELRGRACARLIEQALRLGYRHIDTAQVYERTSVRSAKVCAPRKFDATRYS